VTLRNAVARIILAVCVPEGRRFTTLVPIEEDERRWFQSAVEEEIFRFGSCRTTCPRLRRLKRTGGDEFLAPNGRARHLFNFVLNDPTACVLSREYIPHIAAVSRLLIEKGYDRNRYSFSRYRSFSRDLVLKKRGGTYETDAEFYDARGAIYLHLEAKSSRRDTEALAKQIDAVAELGAMPDKHRKELEYVLDIQPQFLWLVGPGCIDPEQFIYEVKVDGLNASFQRVPSLPDSPR
jgi:hypothetical protein